MLNQLCDYTSGAEQSSVDTRRENKPLLLRYLWISIISAQWAGRSSPKFFPDINLVLITVLCGKEQYYPHVTGTEIRIIGSGSEPVSDRAGI